MRWLSRLWLGIGLTFSLAAQENRLQYWRQLQQERETKLVREYLEPADGLSLGRMEAVEACWKSNLRLKAAALEPAKERSNKLREEGIFDPVLRASIARSRLTQLLSVGNDTTLQAGEGTNYTAELSHLTAEGVRYSLVYRNALDRFLFNQLGVPGLSGNGSLFISLTVPILRGNGSAVTTAEIAKAEKRYQAALSALQELSFQEGGRVLNTYFQLILARRILRSRIHSMVSAERLLELVKETIKEGRAAAYETFEIEQQILQRQSDVDDSLRMVVLHEHELRRQMGLPTGGLRILPKDEVSFLPDVSEWRLPALLAEARQLRPIIAQARANLELAQVEQTRQENLAQPQLDFFTDYRVTQPAGAQSSNQGGGNNWQVGLQFSTPLGNREAEGLLERAKAEVEQAQFRVEDATALVEAEVSEALEEVKIQRRRAQSARAATLKAQEFSQAEENRFLAGYTAASRAIFSQQQETNSREYEARVEVDLLVSEAKLLTALGFVVPERSKL